MHRKQRRVEAKGWANVRPVKPFSRWAVEEIVSSGMEVVGARWLFQGRKEMRLKIFYCKKPLEMRLHGALCSRRELTYERCLDREWRALVPRNRTRNRALSVLDFRKVWCTTRACRFEVLRERKLVPVAVAAEETVRT